MNSLITYTTYCLLYYKQSFLYFIKITVSINSIFCIFSTDDGYYVTEKLLISINNIIPSFYSLHFYLQLKSAAVACISTLCRSDDNLKERISRLREAGVVEKLLEIQQNCQSPLADR